MDKRSILLVDDHRILLDGVKNLLANSNDFEVKDAASSGKEALQFLKSNEYGSLIIEIVHRFIFRLKMVAYLLIKTFHIRLGTE